jgi:hypothetical protein
MPCPYAIVARLVSVQSYRGGRIPDDSPGNGMPVARPRPNLLR